MFSKESYKSARNLQTKQIILHQESSGLGRKIDFIPGLK